MRAFVTYRIADKDLGPIESPLYEYVLAGNGVFIRGKRPGLELQFRIGECEVRGLRGLEEEFVFDYPLVQSSMVNEILRQSRAAAIGDLEKLFHLSWTDNHGWALEVPEQEQSAGACRPLQSGEGSSHARAVIEIHSHHRMAAYFSGTDDKDEQGFRIYGVVGRVLEAPEIRIRAGLHGYVWEIPAEWVFEMPSGLHDCSIDPVELSDVEDREEEL